MAAHRRARMKTLSLLENTRRERLDLQAETIPPAAETLLAERIPLALSARLASGHDSAFVWTARIPGGQQSFPCNVHKVVYHVHGMVY
jgi:hypothetical protein